MAFSKTDLVHIQYGIDFCSHMEHSNFHIPLYINVEHCGGQDITAQIKHMVLGFCTTSMNIFIPFFKENKNV